MVEVDLETLDDCARNILEEIMKNKSTKSQLMAKFMPKYSEEAIGMALEFLEDQKYIEGKKVENLEHYSRITGYYQKISGWNPGKLQEFKDRHRYSTK